MATAAFRSNTKRTPIPASSSSSTRRSRSLSRHPAPDAAPLKGRFVNTERGSGYSDAELDGMTEFFMAIGDDEAADEARRGRTAERRVSTIAERRGRSVVRKGFSDGGKAASEGGSARRRSVSVARYRQPNSESYSSAVTDDEAPDSHSNNGNVKTIRAVYAQKKSDHPVREVDENGLLQAMRKEVQHAVEEIRTELEQIMDHFLTAHHIGSSSSPPSLLYGPAS